MKLREKDLENLLFHHPYLINEIFADLEPRKVRRQVGRKNTRLDLLFDLPSGLCIVELKITRLTVTDVMQLLRYCAAWRASEKLSPVHFLIGKHPVEENSILQVIAESEFEIKLCYLGVDLPSQLVFDENARRYCNLQSNNTGQKILELRF